MPLTWTCTPARNLLMVDDKASFISFTPMEGVPPENIQIRWMLTADIDGKIPVDDSQLQVVANLTAQSPEGALRKVVDFAPYEPQNLAALAREYFGHADYGSLQLTLRVTAPGRDSCVRPRPMLQVLRVFWATASGDNADTAPWQLVWTRKAARGERKVLALGLDLGTSSDSVSAIVDEGDRPAVMYLLEDSSGDDIGRLSFVREEDVGPRYRNPDSDIVAIIPWSRFADRELAVTAPEHTLSVMSSAYRGMSADELMHLRRLKACIQFFQEGMNLRDRWPYAGLSVANLINRIRHAAPLAPCVVRPGVMTHLTFSFSFPYDAVCKLTRGVMRYCDSAVPAIAIPEGQATGLAFLSRAIRKHAVATRPGERQADAVRKCLCEAFNVAPSLQSRMNKLLVVAHDVGDGTAEAALQLVEIGDDPTARNEGVQDRALIRSTASLYWAEPFGGGGRITVLIRTLFVVRLILRLFDPCQDGQEFYSKLTNLMQALGCGGEKQHRPALPISAGQIAEVWPFVLALAERTLMGDPDIRVAAVPNVRYFSKLAESRARCVRDENKQFVTYALDMPSDVDSIRKFVEDFKKESISGRDKAPPYVAAAQKLLAAPFERAQEAAGRAREALVWMVNCLFDFHPDPRDTLDEQRFRKRLGMALWEIAEQCKCQFPSPKPLPQQRVPAAPGREEVISQEEDAIRDPDWRYEMMGSRSPVKPRIPHEKWVLFESLMEEFTRSSSPAPVILEMIPAGDRPSVSDPATFRDGLVGLLGLPPISVFRHTIVPTYVMMHNAFGLFAQAGEIADSRTPKFFMPSGRGTAFAVYSYLLNTYASAHYGADMLLNSVGGDTGAGAARGAVPIIRAIAEDPIGLKHSQVDGALCALLLRRAAPIAVRVEHGTSAAESFPYAVNIVERGGTDTEKRKEELLGPGAWQRPIEKEYTNPGKRFQTAGGGTRHIELLAGYDAAVKTSMVFCSEPLPQAFAGANSSFRAGARRELPKSEDKEGETSESAVIAEAYRDLVPPTIWVYCQGPDTAAEPQTFAYQVHETIELPNIFMEHETALLR